MDCRLDYDSLSRSCAAWQFPNARSVHNDTDDGRFLRFDTLLSGTLKVWSDMDAGGFTALSAPLSTLHGIVTAYAGAGSHSSKQSLPERSPPSKAVILAYHRCYSHHHCWNVVGVEAVCTRWHGESDRGIGVLDSQICQISSPPYSP